MHFVLKNYAQSTIKTIGKKIYTILLPIRQIIYKDCHNCVEYQSSHIKCLFEFLVIYHLSDLRNYDNVQSKCITFFVVVIVIVVFVVWLLLLYLFLLVVWLLPVAVLKNYNFRIWIKKKRKVSEIQTDRSVEFIICVQLKRIGFRAGSISRYEQQVIWLEFVISESMNKWFLHDIYIWPHKLAKCALARIQCVWSDLNCFMKREKNYFQLWNL